MSARNFDCSVLSQRKRNTTEAFNFKRQQTTGIPVFVPVDTQVVLQVKEGSMATYARGYGAEIVNVPCACTLPTGVNGRQ
jgi:hypothetical protein